MIVSNDLKWSSNTNHITQKAMKSFWIIRRLKNLGFEENFLIDVYQKEIRSVLEFGAPVWHGSLTDYDSDRIENIQKKIFKIILQNKYTTYDDACVHFKMNTLKSRRLKICLKFSHKELKKDESLFKKFHPKVINRHTHKKIVEEVTCNTDRYFNSSVPYLSRLMNNDHASKTK